MVPRSRFRFPFIEFVYNLDDGITVVVNGEVSFGCDCIRVMRFCGVRGRRVEILLLRKFKKEGGFLYSTSLNGQAPKPGDWFSEPFSQIDVEADGVVWVDKDGRRTAHFSWPKA